jgi:nucleoside-diphosphate-sugar epimerase
MLTHTFSQPQNPSRVIILGAGGFLGQRLCQGLRTGSIATSALVSRDIDLTESASGKRLREELRPTDAVVFLSAITPDKGRDSATLVRNLNMARNVSEAARTAQVSQLIYASSDAVYAFDHDHISEMTQAAPVDLYGTMHRARELVLSSEAQVPLAILRLTAVYGAGDTHNSYGPNRFVRQALQEGRIALFGNGEETRDHLYVDDAIALIMQVLLHRSTGLVNVASGQSVSFFQAAEQIGAHVGRQVELQCSARQNPITHRRFDIENLKSAFPDILLTPLPEGLRKTIAEMKANFSG